MRDEELEELREYIEKRARSISHKEWDRVRKQILRSLKELHDPDDEEE